MKQQEYKKPIIQSTRTEQIVFKDGMIVTAEHLQTAMHYPVSLFQTLVRAYFGCGIVCGLKVDAVDGCTTCKSDEGKKNVWDVKISQGVALDCQGYPLQLCKPVSINLKPDPCSCDEPPTSVCIAIRRYEAEDSQTKPSCNVAEGGQVHDPLKREQVMIQVFECCKLPENACMRPTLNPPAQEAQDEEDCSTELEKLCDCLKACPDHQCCGEGWVLLACLKLDQCGIKVIDNSQRKYVKPIDCVCSPEGEVNVNEPNPAPKEKPDLTQVASEQTPGKPKTGGKGR